MIGELSVQVKTALKMLHENGFEAYIVGGCVRDMILQLSPKDVDITTNALPNQVSQIFKSHRVIETGLKHGTVTVMIDNIPLEITTYRTDGEYLDNRHPESVQFTSSLKEDLARRDFTINAIAYDENSGFIDFFGGIEDIKNKKIRCVGNADKRFEEDALRILRGIRFASVLGFEIETETSCAMFRNKNRLNNISKERVTVEYLKLICGKNQKQVMTDYIEILGEVVPDLLPMKGFNQNNPYHIYDVLEHSLVAVEDTPPFPPYLRLAALLHDVGKPLCYTQDEKGTGHFYGHSKLSEQTAEKILTYLKLDRFTIDRVCTLIKYHDTPIKSDKKIIKKWLNRLTEPVFREILLIKKADTFAHNPVFHERLDELNEISKILDEIIVEQECFSLKDLAINGNDLIEIGLSGKQIGEMLEHLLHAVMEEKTKNEYGSLIEEAKKHRL
ncbi:MAG: poly(A) polymerase [Oscillospiraceae bacterium]|jgi:tRNA nucleotidyltransferase (CCA-adding enzyme)|nr:poly(A) polymerase [Oscillospiraceae bacterium]